MGVSMSEHYRSTPTDPLGDMPILQGEEVIRMIILYLLLYVVACACFAIAAFMKTQPRINMMALGLLAFALVPTIQTLIRVD